MLYAIGKPNETVRQFVSVATEREAALQCLPGETYVESTVAAPSTISNGEVVVIQLTDDQIKEEKWAIVKQQRNALLDQCRWTIAPDSPLTVECQENWLNYCKTLNRITVDFDDPDHIDWPTQPSLEYHDPELGEDAAKN